MQPPLSWAARLWLPLALAVGLSRWLSLQDANADLRVYVSVLAASVRPSTVGFLGVRGAQDPQESEGRGLLKEVEGAQPAGRGDGEEGRERQHDRLLHDLVADVRGEREADAHGAEHELGRVEEFQLGSFEDRMGG